MTDTIETTENPFEAKAQGIVDIWVGDNTGVCLGMSDLVSAIAAALEAERLEGQNDIWLWLDDETADDPILNAIVKSMMAKHKRAAAIRNRETDNE
jgi:hypothetical protein